MKMKLIASFIALAALTISAMSVNALAIGTGPATGSYVITNNANNLELSVRSGGAILNSPSGYAWKLTESPARNPYFYIITTADGRGALAYDMAKSNFYMAAPNDADLNQHWMIRKVANGYEIESMDGNDFGNDYVLFAESKSISVPGSVVMGTRQDNTTLDVWRITAAGAAPTFTPTPTPTPANATAYTAPKPVSDPPNGSYIESGDKVSLMPSSSLRGASVVYSMLDPNRNSNVTWYYSTTPINSPVSGTLEFWAKTVCTGYYDSDVVRFVFQVQNRAPAPTPAPVPTQAPARPSQQLTQVVLKVTMNQLQYTINGVPAMFDVAPYLDTKANRSMIPMRFIAEAFGATVDWNDATRTQTIMLNGKTFKLTEGVPLPDGMGTPVLVKDRFFVPLRYVSQELGASVDWDDATSTNTIVYYK